MQAWGQFQHILHSSKRVRAISQLQLHIIHVYLKTLLLSTSQC